MFKINNRNTKTIYEIFSKLTRKIPEWRHWRHSGVFIVIFEQISDIVLLLPLLTLNKQMTDASYEVCYFNTEFKGVLERSWLDGSTSLIYILLLIFYVSHSILNYSQIFNNQIFVSVDGECQSQKSFALYNLIWFLTRKIIVYFILYIFYHIFYSRTIDPEENYAPNPKTNPNPNPNRGRGEGGIVRTPFSEYLCI